MKYLILVLLLAVNCFAQSLVSEIHKVSPTGVHEKIGEIALADTAQGLEMKIMLSNLSPGQHGFHIHENPSCEPGEKDGKPAAGIAAGAHYDPKKTGKHAGPTGAGHAGDLPVLEVDAQGRANLVAYLKKLTLADVKNRSIMIHEGKDNYSDMPLPLGGGGARIACGVIK